MRALLAPSILALLSSAAFAQDAAAPAAPAAAAPSEGSGDGDASEPTAAPSEGSGDGDASEPTAEGEAAPSEGSGDGDASEPTAEGGEAASGETADTATPETPAEPEKPKPPKLLVLDLQDKGAGQQQVDAISQAIAGQALKSYSDGPVVTLQQLKSTLDAAALQAAVGCDAEGCMANIASQVEAQRVLGGNVTRVGEDLVLTLIVVEASTGNRIGDVQRKVPDYQDLYFYAARELTSVLLTGKGIDSKVPVRVESKPAGANVFVDGNLVGVAPVTVPVEPGSHQVRARLDGYVDWGSDVTVEPQTPISLSASLANPPLRLWPAAAALGGVSLVAAGVAIGFGVAAQNSYDGAFGDDTTVANSYLGASPVTSVELAQKQQTVEQLNAVNIALWVTAGTAAVLAVAVEAVDLAFWLTAEDITEE